MTVLSIIQRVSDEVGVPRPTSVVGSTDNSARRIYSLLLRTAKDLRASEEWAFLRKEGTFTLASGDSTYALPADFEAWINETQWDGSNHWQLIGPLSPQEWQQKKRGVTSTTPRRMFTVKGGGSDRVEITPTPTASEAGQILYFEYISTNVFLPKIWTSGESGILVGDYRSYNGNIYISTTAGTTGATPPTHVTDTPVSDGGVTWDYSLIAYSPTSDEDISVLDEEILILGTIYRWKRGKGLDYEDSYLEYRDAIKKQLVNERGMRTASYDGGAILQTGRWNIPDTGYGI